MTDSMDEPKLLAALTFLVVGLGTEQDRKAALRAKWSACREFPPHVVQDLARCDARTNSAIAMVDEVLEALGIPKEDRIRVGTSVTDYGVELAKRVLEGGYAPIWREALKDV